MKTHVYEENCSYWIHHEQYLAWSTIYNYNKRYAFMNICVEEERKNHPSLFLVGTLLRIWNILSLPDFVPYWSGRNLPKFQFARPNEIEQNSGKHPQFNVFGQISNILHKFEFFLDKITNFFGQFSKCLDKTPMNLLTIVCFNKETCV